MEINKFADLSEKELTKKHPDGIIIPDEFKNLNYTGLAKKKSKKTVVNNTTVNSANDTNNSNSTNSTNATNTTNTTNNTVVPKKETEENDSNSWDWNKKGMVSAPYD